VKSTDQRRSAAALGTSVTAEANVVKRPILPNSEHCSG
jgi:hypothetical protein